MRKILPVALLVFGIGWTAFWVIMLASGRLAGGSGDFSLPPFTIFGLAAIVVGLRRLRRKDDADQQ